MSDPRNNVSFEWPSFCFGWTIDVLVEFFDKWSLKFAKCHGCALDVKSLKHELLKKPWTIATNNSSIYNNMSQNI